MINTIVLILYWVITIGSMAAALYAARLWRKSADVSPDPFPNGVVESGDPTIANAQWTAAMLASAMKVADLNRPAAIWTSRAVLLSVTAAVLDHLH